MQVLLFDIDGTLIRTGPTVRAAFFQALEEVYGFLPELNGYSFGGRTDPQIVRELMVRNGVEESEVAERIPTALDRYLERLEATSLPAGHGTVLPGVVALLDRCRATADVRLGLLTGNVERGARAKLEPLGLWDYFEFGGFADVSEDRARVAAAALSCARARVGEELEAGAVTVIGDTEFDISCARAIGARAVAVATGTRSSAALALHAPDALFPDLADLECVWRRLTGAAG